MGTGRGVGEPTIAADRTRRPRSFTFVEQHLVFNCKPAEEPCVPSDAAHEERPRIVNVAPDP